MKKKTNGKSNACCVFLKSLWFWLIVIGIILCAVNIGLSCRFIGTAGSNIFTAVSGWVSGIATIVLGVITFLQNKNYVLASAKREIKDNIHNEQIKIVEICHSIAQFSSIKKPLSILVENDVTAKDLLAYNLEIDAMREKLLSTNHLLQLFNYIPCSMGLLVVKITELLMTTYKQYQYAAKHCANDLLLGTDIKTISEFTKIWFFEIMELCKQANRELVKFSQSIDKVRSVVELQNVLKVEEQQTVMARKEIQEIIQKALENEQNNV